MTLRTKRSTYWKLKARISDAVDRPRLPLALARFRRSHEFWLLLVILALSLVLALATDSFLTLQNLFDLLTSNAFVGILASGLLVVLIAGGIDISFTATASVAQYVALTLGIRHGLGWLALFGVAGAIGILCGIVNAVFITKLRISSIIVSMSRSLKTQFLLMAGCPLRSLSPRACGRSPS